MPRHTGRLTALALTAMSLLVGCGQSGASGWQACTWVYARDTNHRLFEVFSLDGGKEHRLTDGERSDAPSLSPDGKRIVFTRGIGVSDECCGFPNTELYVMDADGDDQHRLLDGEGDDDTPVWSPDGSMIAFIRSPSGRVAVGRDPKELLMVVPFSKGEAGEPRVVAEVNSHEVPVWSPDSTRLAWVEAPSLPPPPAVSDPINPPLRPSPGSSDRLEGSALPPGIHRVSPAPPPDATLVSPDVEFRPPGGTRPSPQPPAPSTTIRWKTVTGTKSGKLSVPEDSNWAPAWIDNGHLVLSVSKPAGPSLTRDLVRVRISDGTVSSLGVPVVLPVGIYNGRIAGMVQGDKPGDSHLVVVDQDGGGYQKVAKIRMKYPYRGMTISAVCPD